MLVSLGCPLRCGQDYLRHYEFWGHNCYLNNEFCSTFIWTDPTTKNNLPSNHINKGNRVCSEIWTCSDVYEEKMGLKQEVYFKGL